MTIHLCHMCEEEEEEVRSSIEVNSVVELVVLKAQSVPADHDPVAGEPPVQQAVVGVRAKCCA